jgi:RNA polymerase sigma-70 factor (ECF subfamily)
MDSESINQRLSRITTRWSLVCQAHSGSKQTASEAQLRLLQRYGGAIQRYLLGALRDAEAAEELSQEFALRFIRGDFRGVDPQRGRFRDYVKTVLFRLVANFHKQRQAQPRPLLAEVAEPAGPAESLDADRDFLDSWQRELLDLAWEELAALEKKTGQPFHAVLRLRIENPEDEMTSAQMAERLSVQFGRKFTADGVRKTLQRAREKFAELLLDDVLHSLDNPTPQQLEQELRDLGLLAYCRPALERWEEKS